MRPSLFSGECHADAEPATLPEWESGPTSKETTETAASSQTTVQSQPTYASISAIGGGDGSGGGDGGGDENAPAFLVSGESNCSLSTRANAANV
jgi:hypothetical protein